MCKIIPPQQILHNFSTLADAPYLDEVDDSTMLRTAMCVCDMSPACQDGASFCAYCFRCFLFCLKWLLGTTCNSKPFKLTGTTCYHRVFKSDMMGFIYHTVSLLANASKGSSGVTQCDGGRSLPSFAENTLPLFLLPFLRISCFNLFYVW